MSDSNIVLTFDGEATAGHRLEAETVAASLIGVQKAVRMLASAEREGWTGSKKKYKPTRSIREHVLLKVSVPVEGSFVLPMTVADDDPGTGAIVAKYAAFLDWLAGAEPRPDIRGGVLDHLLIATQEWLPRREDLFVRPMVGGRQLRNLTVAALERARDLLADRPVREGKVIGRLTRAYLEEGEMRLRHPPTGRTFRMPLPDAVRGNLTLSRGQWVEVMGKFHADADGEPLDFVEVSYIGLPDLGPMLVSEFVADSKVIHISPPLELAVVLDAESHQLYVAQDKSIGLHAFSADRAALAREVADHLAFLWRAYGTAPVSVLAPDAIALQARLQARLTEVR